MEPFLIFQIVVHGGIINGEETVADGYFAASIGQVSQTTIEHYIENQG